MNLNEARELREELENIEAAMNRIVAKAAELPCADELEDLEKAVGNIESSMDSIIEKAGELPAAESL
ncbi:MAG TPA: hypothetical protein VH120_07630 [Gemmataceae bacterium]|jgi:hypothetical protein|nr:hypothetical protein [Gemmataceae bacterium]